MSMSRQDYELVASALAVEWRRAVQVTNQRERTVRMDQIEMVAQILAINFDAENPRFDARRFMLAACWPPAPQPWAADIAPEVF